MVDAQKGYMNEASRCYEVSSSSESNSTLGSFDQLPSGFRIHPALQVRRIIITGTISFCNNHSQELPCVISFSNNADVYNQTNQCQHVNKSRADPTQLWAMDSLAMRFTTQRSARSHYFFCPKLFRMLNGQADIFVVCTKWNGLFNTVGFSSYTLTLHIVVLGVRLPKFEGHSYIIPKCSTIHC